jgi:hypothetical protein
MTAANDNRHARKKRVRADASVATMTRIIHDLYGPAATKQQEAEPVAEKAPEAMASPH